MEASETPGGEGTPAEDVGSGEGDVQPSGAPDAGDGQSEAPAEQPDTGNGDGESQSDAGDGEGDGGDGGE